MSDAICLTVDADDDELAGEATPALRAPTPATACDDDVFELDEPAALLLPPKDAGRALDDAVAVIRSDEEDYWLGGVGIGARGAQRAWWVRRSGRGAGAQGDDEVTAQVCCAVRRFESAVISCVR